MKNDSPFHRKIASNVLSRREFLWRSGGGLGGLALASMLGRIERWRATACWAESCIFPPRPNGWFNSSWRARPAISILFDYKPELVKRDGQPSDFGESRGSVSKWTRTVAEAGLGFQAVRPVRARCSAKPSRRLARSSTTWRSFTMWSANPACTPRDLAAGHGISAPRISRRGLLGELRSGLDERQSADLRRAARPSRLRFQWREELGLRLSAVATQRHDYLSRRARRRSPICFRINPALHHAKKARLMRSN